MRCAHCKDRHDTVAEVRTCATAEAAHGEAEAAADAAAMHAEEVAYARSREAQAEAGTWFGPQTEADTWGEHDEPDPGWCISCGGAPHEPPRRGCLARAGHAEDPGACEYGACGTYTRCMKHRAEDAQRGVKNAMFKAYND
jgi:hypothetical protein